MTFVAQETLFSNAVRLASIAINDRMESLAPCPHFAYRSRARADTLGGSAGLLFSGDMKIRDFSNFRGSLTVGKPYLLRERNTHER
jgi:hypothetical protein